MVAEVVHSWRFENEYWDSLSLSKHCMSYNGQIFDSSMYRFMLDFFLSTADLSLKYCKYRARSSITQHK